MKIFHRLLSVLLGYATISVFNTPAFAASNEAENLSTGDNEWESKIKYVDFNDEILNGDGCDDPLCRPPMPA